MADLGPGRPYLLFYPDNNGDDVPDGVRFSRTANAKGGVFVGNLHQMSEYNATANDHMRRDTATGGNWVCTCAACCAIRSLVGMEKALGVRQLVRQLLDIEARLTQEPDAVSRRKLQDQYHGLYDKLAADVSK